MLKRLFGSKKTDQTDADSAEAVTGEDAGHAFLPPSVQLNGVTLVRNGAGVRKRFGIPVYRMAVYLPAKAGSAQAAIGMPGPRQIRMVALRSISGDTLASAFLNGVRKNTSAENSTAYLEKMGQVIGIFRTEDSVEAGQTFHVDLLPESGAFFFINGKLKGEPIVSAGFNEAILSIWLGEEPADSGLKSALLGQ